MLEVWNRVVIRQKIKFFLCLPPPSPSLRPLPLPPSLPPPLLSLPSLPPPLPPSSPFPPSLPPSLPPSVTLYSCSRLGSNCAQCLSVADYNCQFCDFSCSLSDQCSTIIETVEDCDFPIISSVRSLAVYVIARARAQAVSRILYCGTPLITTPCEDTLNSRHFASPNSTFFHP